MSSRSAAGAHAQPVKPLAAFWDALDARTRANLLAVKRAQLAPLLPCAACAALLANADPTGAAMLGDLRAFALVHAKPSLLVCQTRPTASPSLAPGPQRSPSEADRANYKAPRSFWR